MAHCWRSKTDLYKRIKRSYCSCDSNTNDRIVCIWHFGIPRPNELLLEINSNYSTVSIQTWTETHIHHCIQISSFFLTKHFEGEQCQIKPITCMEIIYKKGFGPRFSLLAGCGRSAMNESGHIDGGISELCNWGKVAYRWWSDSAWQPLVWSGGPVSRRGGPEMFNSWRVFSNVSVNCWTFVNCANSVFGIESDLN